MPTTTLLTTLEVVALLRDIVLIVFLAVAFLALFVFSTLGVLFYRRLVRVLERVEHGLANVDEFTTAVTGSIHRASEFAGLLSIGSLLGRLFGRGRKDG